MKEHPKVFGLSTRKGGAVIYEDGEDSRSLFNIPVERQCRLLEMECRDRAGLEMYLWKTITDDVEHHETTEDHLGREEVQGLTLGAL